MTVAETAVLCILTDRTFGTGCAATPGQGENANADITAVAGDRTGFHTSRHLLGVAMATIVRD